MTTIQSIQELENKLAIRESELIKLGQQLYQQQLVLTEMFRKFSNYENMCEPTIGRVLDRFIVKSDPDKEETHRKNNTILKYIKWADLTLNEKYAKFHNENTLRKITDIIINRSDIQGDQKIRHLRWITSLIKFAVCAYPDLYKTDVLVGLPMVKKTPKSDKRPHMPYTSAQLKCLFNPNNTFFRKNPDFFWGCMLALFTGSRKNAVFTLQYKDIFQQDGIWCINFIEDCPGVKKLKTEDSERLVPMHSTLIKTGFLNYINNKPHNSKNDFIFPICLTPSGKFNHHIARKFFQFLEQIGIKDTGAERYDFHSFRKNANIAMEKCGILRSYIDKIIGWQSNVSEGVRSYSNYSIKQISEQLEKLKYNSLKKEFKHWKKVMTKITQ